MSLMKCSSSIKHGLGISLPLVMISLTASGLGDGSDAILLVWMICLVLADGGVCMSVMRRILKKVSWMMMNYVVVH